MRRRAAAAAACLLAGCAQSPPPYERPAAPVPRNWPSEAGGSRAAADIGWREFFTDPQLRSLIEAALEHNRDLRIAAARVEEARAAAGLARAERIPGIEAQASGNRSRTPFDLSQTGRARTAGRWDLGLGITAFELDFWGRVASLDEAARAQYLAAAHAQRALHIGLVAEVAASYITRLELMERESLAAQAEASRGDTLKLVQRRREAGLAADLDVLAAEAAVQAARARLAEIRGSRNAAENALRLLTGVAPDTMAGRPLSAQGFTADPAPGLSSEVLLRRPDVMAAEQRLVAAHANVAAARAAFLPRIALTASLGTASAALSGLFGAGSGAWLFQPVLRLPLFDGGRTQANVDLAQARRTVAVAEYERAIQQAFREVADALAARSQAAQRLAHQEALARAQHERLAKVEARQRAGLASYLEVLDAQRESLAAGEALTGARRDSLAAALSLYKTLGGGAEPGAAR